MRPLPCKQIGRRRYLNRQWVLRHERRKLQHFSPLEQNLLHFLSLVFFFKIQTEKDVLVKDLNIKKENINPLNP